MRKDFRSWIILVGCIVVAFGLLARVAYAAECQLAAPMEGVVETTAYTSGDGSGTTEKLPISKLRFPLEVHAKSPVNLYEIVVDGKHLWIDPMDFRDGNCVAAAAMDAAPVTEGQAVLGIRGAKKVGR